MALSSGLQTDWEVTQIWVIVLVLVGLGRQIEVSNLDMRILLSDSIQALGWFGLPRSISRFF